MLKRSQWLENARKLDWEFSYVREEDVFPEVASGRPWLPHDAMEGLGRALPHVVRRIRAHAEQEGRRARGRSARPSANRKTSGGCPRPWLSALKLHAATLPLAEFAAVVGNLRGARFGRDSAWRSMATLGALDELRHTQIPLSSMHGLVRHDEQFDWTHRFYHSNNWVAIAARHLFDELLLSSNADRIRHRHALRLRDGLHQPAVRGALVARARRRRSHVRADVATASRATRRAMPRSGCPCWTRSSSTTRPMRSTCSTSGSGAPGCFSRS